jgi:hypothetical protein
VTRVMVSRPLESPRKSAYEPFHKHVHNIYSIPPTFILQGCTDLRSVTWTKVSLKDAKILATPKTSSPVVLLALCKPRTISQKQEAERKRGRYWEEILGKCGIFTISDLGAKGDVLLGGACSFLWRHGEFVVLCNLLQYLRDRKFVVFRRINCVEILVTPRLCHGEH